MLFFVNNQSQAIETKETIGYRIEFLLSPVSEYQRLYSCM